MINVDISICGVRSMECSTSTIVVLLKLITSTLNTQICKLKKPKKKKNTFDKFLQMNSGGVVFYMCLNKDISPLLSM